MKNLFFLLLCVLSISVFSCKEKDCEKNGTGELTIINAIDVDMIVSIDDGPEFILEPNEEKTETVVAGVHSIDVTRPIQGIVTTSGFGKDIFVCKEGILRVEF